MNLSGTKSRVAGISQELALKWADTKNYWRDAKSLEFEKQYMQELFERMNKAVIMIEKLDEVINKVQKDCE